MTFAFPAGEDKRGDIITAGICQRTYNSPTQRSSPPRPPPEPPFFGNQPRKGGIKMATKIGHFLINKSAASAQPHQSTPPWTWFLAFTPISFIHRDMQVHRQRTISRSQVHFANRYSVIRRQYASCQNYLHRLTIMLVRDYHLCAAWFLYLFAPAARW